MHIHHHLILAAVAAIAMLGWLALPLRRTRWRFVLTLLAVFVTGMIASPIARVGAPLSRVLASYAIDEMAEPAPATCTHPPQTPSS